MPSTARVEEWYVTPEEYLASEAVSTERHEYVAGMVYAMSGTSVGHERVLGNIDRELGRQLRGSRCEAFRSEIKVYFRIGEDEFFYYPDVVVDCGCPSDESLQTKEPRIIFEVLSPSTARADRHEKREHYQQLPTLDVYVLVDLARVAVTVYRREGGGWTTEYLNDLQAVLDLPTVNCSLLLAGIYEHVLPNAG